MEFDISTILYIVITLVAVIVGLLGKKKKPEGQPGGAEGSESQPGFFESLEQALRMGQENPQVTDLQSFEEDLPAEEHLDYERDKAPAPEPVATPSMMDEYERILKDRQADDPDIFFTGEGEMDQVLEVIDLDPDSDANFFEMVQEFDAKTAIVYSAIINRLDY